MRLRPIREEDEPLLLEVYAGSRERELARVPWSAEEKRAFLDMQFRAQHLHYQTYFPDARFDVIEREGQAIGRLYVDRRRDEIRLIDVALLPPYRGRGIGAALLRALQQEARTSGRALRLRVEPDNPALRLYEQLSFRKVSGDDIYWLLEWRPEPAADEVR